MKNGRILSGELAIVNQILPHFHPWAWELFLTGQANNWSPAEISMARDIEQWKLGQISEDEKLLVRRCLGFFAGSESLVSNNLLLGIFRCVSDAECRQYILRQAYEEAIHNQTVVYVCDSLGLDVQEVYEAYQNIPSIKAKDDFLMSITSDLSRSNLDVGTVAGKREALRNLVTYYVVCEGIMFYSGFAMLLSFGRQNKLPGLSEQIQYTLRDESLHVQFGIRLINTIRSQEGSIVWDDDFAREVVRHIERAATLEVDYAKDILPNGVLGLNADMFIDYMRHIANRRLEQLGLSPLFKGTRNPFPWLSETIDLPKMKNFFETRVTNYAVGKLVDDF